MKKIGIIGGLGSFASSYLLKQILTLSAQHHDIHNDDDYPEIILHSMASAGLKPDGQYKPEFLRDLVFNSHNLARLNVDVIAIACNTIHENYDFLHSKIRTPLLNIVDISARKLKAHNVSDIAVLCSSFSREKEVHRKVFDSYGIHTQYLENVELRVKLDQIIFDVLRGRFGYQQLANLNEIIQHYRQQNLPVLLGCTELTVLYEQLEHTENIYDSSFLLAQYIVTEHYKDRYARI